VRRLVTTLHEYVVVEVTEACPHACVHCYNYWREDRAPVFSPDTLRRADILNVIRKIRRDAPLRVVALSGGEPLLRPDIADICTDLVNDGLRVAVITSGALLTPARTARFPAGTTFEITLFGADAGLHDRIVGRPGAFQRVLNGAACALENGCTIVVSVVLNRLNTHCTRDALELGLALGADAFLLNRINFSRLTLPDAHWLAPTREQLTHALDAAESFAVQYEAPIAVSVPIPPCVVDPAPYPHLLFGWCPRGGARAYYTVSQNGTLRPCNHSSVVLGDLREESFADIVNSRKATDFWAPVPPQCRTCEHPLRNMCRGGCPAASDECYGTRKRVDPLVHIMPPLAEQASAACPVSSEWPTRSERPIPALT
jgi:pyrroloquinoline quinone biosynthesis protein E